MDKHLLDARVRAPASLVIAAAAFALILGGVTLLGQGCAQKSAQGPFAKDPPPPTPDTPPPPDPITDPPPDPPPT
jgi:hypothetical protein